MQCTSTFSTCVLSDEVYSPGSGCEDCPEEANQCINDRLCCELYSCACNAHACLLPHCVSVSTLLLVNFCLAQTGKVAQVPPDTDADTPTTKPNPSQ